MMCALQFKLGFHGTWARRIQEENLAEANIAWELVSAKRSAAVSSRDQEISDARWYLQQLPETTMGIGSHAVS